MPRFLLLIALIALAACDRDQPVGPRPTLSGPWIAATHSGTVLQIQVHDRDNPGPREIVVSSRSIAGYVLVCSGTTVSPSGVVTPGSCIQQPRYAEYQHLGTYTTDAQGRVAVPVGSSTHGWRACLADRPTVCAATPDT